jgi:hypothetical protein
MKTSPKHFLLGAFLCLIIGGIASFQIFTSTPFVQQEIVFQAHWWNDGSSLLSSLFDPKRNDGAPGRFRYIEYLAEALYWKLAAVPLIPRTLHDYFAWLGSWIMSFFFLQIFRKRRLSLLSQALLFCLFWLGIPTFMVTTWHYRKAKFIVGFLFLLIALHLELGKRRPWLLPLWLMGCLTDPFFVVLAPLLPLSHDLSHRAKKFVNTRYALMGLLLSAALVFFLNAVIGPTFHKGTAFIWDHIPGKPENFLNVSQWRLFPQILPQLAGLTENEILKGAAAWMGILFFLVLYFCARRSLANRGNWILCFLFSLPLAAILVHPSYNHEGIFLSYYGYPIFILFVLSLVDILEMAEKWPERARSVPLFAWGTWGLLAFTIVFHQFHREQVFAKWVHDHVGGKRVNEKWATDYKLIRDLRAELSHENTKNITLGFDWANFRSDEPMHIYSDWGSRQEHTSLAYLLIPLLFRQEIKEGRLIP